MHVKILEFVGPFW